MPHILKETIEFLMTTIPRPSAMSASIHLTRYFTVTALNGDPGAAMSYYSLPDSILHSAEVALVEVLQKRPQTLSDEATLECVLKQTIPDQDQRFAVIRSVQASAAASLSRATLAHGGDRYFTVSHRCPHWTEGKTNALLIGFGGNLRPLAKSSSIKRLDIVDLSYSRRRKDMDLTVANLRDETGKANINVYERLEASHFRDYDVISITGSTLANGTLDKTLASISPQATVVLQGQTAAIHPKTLFEHGVSLIATTIKPSAIIELAQRDRSGDPLRDSLEGGLPWVFLTPNQKLHN